MATLANSNENRADQIAQLKELMAQKDNRINSLFERLIADTEGLEDYNLSSAKKNEIIIGIEFIIARLRFILCDELKCVEYALNVLDGDSTQKQVQTIFSKRRTYLVSIYGKVNDMREDLSLIEKTFYYNRY